MSTMVHLIHIGGEILQLFNQMSIANLNLQKLIFRDIAAMYMHVHNVTVVYIKYTILK